MWSVPSSSRNPQSLVLRSLAAGAVMLLPLTQARGNEHAVAATLHGGAQQALAAAEGIDARNSGSSRVALPAKAVPSFRTKLVAPISFPPASDALGRLVVVHGSGKLSQLDASGRPEWTARLGTDAAASAPAIGSDETRWVVTRAGDIVGVSAGGRERHRRRLPGLLEVGAVELVPVRAGGLCLASGRQVGCLDHTGKLSWLAQAREPVVAVLEAANSVVAVGAGGSVVRRDAEGRLVDLGELGGSVITAAISPDEKQLFAVVGQRDVVSLDLGSGARRMVFSEPSLTLSGGVSVGPAGLRVVASGSLLIGFGAGGQESFRAPVAQSPLQATGRAVMPLVDARGRSAISLPDAGLSLVSPSGEVEVVPGSACPEPLRPTPLGPGKLALSCRSGLVLGFSGKAP